MEGNFSLKDVMNFTGADKNTILRVADLYAKSAFKRKQMPPVINVG